MNSVTLYYRDCKSDKVYQAAIEPSGNLFVVTFAYGRRGATLQTGIKTPIPVDFPTAESVFETLVKAKTAKGYTPGESGAPYQGHENEGSVTDIRPQPLNTIDEMQALAFARSRLWCLQEKMDGRRLLVKKQGAEIHGINRRGLLCGIPSIVISEIREIEAISSSTEKSSGKFTTSLICSPRMANRGCRDSIKIGSMRSKSCFRAALTNMYGRSKRSTEQTKRARLCNSYSNAERKESPSSSSLLRMKVGAQLQAGLHLNTNSRRPDRSLSLERTRREASP